MGNSRGDFQRISVEIVVYRDVFQIVREQCWLNETLLICDWTTEGSRVEEEMVDTVQATEQDLQAVLSGS